MKIAFSSMSGEYSEKCHHPHHSCCNRPDCHFHLDLQEKGESQLAETHSDHNSNELDLKIEINIHKPKCPNLTLH